MSSDERIRVLWFIKCLGYGGAERLLISAAEARDTTRFRYEAAYVLPSLRALVPDLEAAGVPVLCLGSSDANRDVRWMGRLRRLLLERPVDVVHFHLPYTAGLGRLVVRSLPSGARPMMVTTEHNVWSTNPLPLRALNALTARLDSASIAVSEVVRDALPVHHRRRTEVLVHGVSRASLAYRDEWRTDVRRELGVAPHEVLVGTVANLRPGKGYEVLLPAARRLVDLGLPIRFAAVGVGPLEAEVTALHRRLRLEDRFLLLGGRSDPMRVVAAFDVFVLASLSEGFPVSVMEALTLGVPLVTSAVGGIPGAVTDGVQGLLVTPGREDELVGALRRLVLDHDMRARMAASASALGEAFDITPAVRRAEAIYQSVVKPGRRAGTARSN